MLRLKSIKRRHALGRALLIGAAGVFAPALVQAHFVLVTPDSWMSQDSLGLPEKLGPCGDEGGGTPTGKVTVFQPGQTISVTINEVITHPGHYRVALAVNDRSELPAEPQVTPTAFDPCGSAAIQSPPTFPILADNILPHTQAFAGPQTFTVTLPTNVTCTKCTLQVLEFMSSHPAPCFYHHCADISIQADSLSCGDGTVQSGEQCDDGNTVSGDGCDSTCRLETATATPSNTPVPPVITPTVAPTTTGTAVVTECGTIVQPKLTIRKLNTPPGDDILSFKGTLTLPSPVSPALNPLANGVRLLIDGTGGTVLDVTVSGGTGWTVNRNGTKWTYRNKTPTPPGGISKVVIQDKSAATPGLVRFAVNGKAGSLAVAAADLPVTAGMMIAAGGQCGEASFPSCAFNKSASMLKCK